MIKKIIHNSAFLFISQSASYLLSAITSIILVRYLGKELYGIHSFATEYAVLFGMAIDFGLLQIITRECARNIDQIGKYFHSGLILSLFFTLIVWFLLFVSFFISSFSPIVYKVIILIFLSVMINNIARVFISILRAMQKMIFEAIFVFASYLLTFILVSISVYLKLDIVSISIADTSATLLSFILLIYLFNKSVNIGKPIFDIKTIKYLFNSSKYLFLTTFFTYLYWEVETLFIKYFDSYSNTGIYHAAINFYDKIILLTHPFAIAVMPVLSSLYKNNRKRYGIYLKNIISMIILIGLPSSAGTWFISYKLTVLIYSKNFIMSGFILKILSFGMLFYLLRDFLEDNFILINKEHRLLIINLFTAGIALSLYFILLHFFDYRIAPFIKISIEGIIFLLYLINLREHNFHVIDNSVLLKSIIATTCMSIFLYFIKKWNIMLNIGIGVIIYIGVLLILKPFNTAELILMFKDYRKKK